ncbi:hypothetical protein [Streptomyces sp. NBC_01497]|uniref:hypothetical protein n=1 Tax=Streptomyces sp. NBC_01497 TaxID=2903885 RepID=UPI002E35228A|nr:hypothetical protein [Streptomyces sp. NBC_01497]
MIRGEPVAERLWHGAELTSVPLRVTSHARRRAGDATAGQPAPWTLPDFTVDDEGPGDTLAASLDDPLSSSGGRYAGSTSCTWAYVVPCAREFSYARGDRAARAAAVAYACSAGVPEDRPDWED